MKALFAFASWIADQCAPSGFGVLLIHRCHVDQNVEASQRLHRFVHGRDDFGLVGRVRAKHRRLDARSSRRLRSCFGGIARAAIGQRQRASTVCQAAATTCPIRAPPVINATLPFGSIMPHAPQQPAIRAFVVYLKMCLAQVPLRGFTPIYVDGSFILRLCRWGAVSTRISRIPPRLGIESGAMRLVDRGDTSGRK